MFQSNEKEKWATVRAQVQGCRNKERETQDKDETAAAGTTGTNEEGLILNMHAEFK